MNMWQHFCQWAHYSKPSFFVQKYNLLCPILCLDFWHVNSIFWGWHNTCQIQICLKVKFCQNWIFGQKLTFSTACELAPLLFIDPLRIIGNPCLYLTLLHTSCTAHDISDFSFITCHSGQLEIEGDNHTTVGKINNFFRHENKSFDGRKLFH